VNERLARTYYSNGRYIPLLLVGVGLGFIVIFLLAQLGALGEPAPQLLYIGGITILFAIAHIPLLALAQRNKGIAATLYDSALVGIFVILLTLFWQGIAFLAILIVSITILMAIRNGIPRKYIPALVLLFIAVISGIRYVDVNSPVDRLQNNASAAAASIVFVLATILLLLTIIGISQNRRFRSLQSLLLTSFVIIVLVPTVMTASLAGIGAYTSGETQAFSTLEAITTLKMNQIETLLASSRKDAEALLADSRFRTNALVVLTSPTLDPILEKNYKAQVRTRTMDILTAGAETYTEIMVLDTQGNVVISTLPEREGSSLAKLAFVEQGRLNFYAGFAEEPTFGTENLIIASPIFDPNGQVVQGILVLRSNAGFIKEVMEKTPGFSEAETYLVNLHFRPVTRTSIPVEIVNSRASLESIRKKLSGGKSIYLNYNGQSVLGYYEWFEPLQVAAIAEVPQSFVVLSSFHTLAGSALLALFVAAVAVIAVVISARTISNPIKTLAQTTESFAAGKWSARAIVDREDEIGALAKAYNQMAGQLQEIIGKLEQRVTDRTQDLESQTLRLRVAAEIARDAASAHDLSDLLAQAAELICQRFSFYHTGIFLLDNDKDYAVLVASPTEAGKKMIENGHKLRVGEIGIVGRVAATGEPRVALNTGTDAAYFNNPYLPDTKSEMALPLKTENNVIGVLDVQSDQPQAFNEDDVAIMQIMADQLATAIERTRLLQEVQRSLKELESAYGRFTSDNWEKSSAGSLMGNRGYRFDNIRIEPITEMPEIAETAIRTGTIISSNGSGFGIDKEHKVAIPIKLRGQTIGVVNLKLKEGYDHNTVSIIELAAERLASAMESARLYEEARLRADREQSISRVSTAISASTEYEEILQTTVREIGSILGDTEVAIQILEEPTATKRAEQKEQ
ncbi:MAG TPA: GAF domain-containing protein, partial [Anaerolineales bacterium]|nr:GAF domain-containing protein [Anaerolineales bacterium]